MEIQCPKCKKTQMTKGRVEFPCRYCGTMLKDPRVVDEVTNKLVELDEVIKIAHRNGVASKMKEIYSLPTYDKEMQE